MGQRLSFDLFAVKIFVIVFPDLVSGVSLDLVALAGVVDGQVLAQNHEEFFEGRGLANSAQPEEEDGEAGVFEVDFAFGVVLDEFADVHEAELVGDFFFGCHGVSQFPK